MSNVFTEEWYREAVNRLSPGGVKEHTAVEAEEGEPRLTDAPRGTTVKSSARTSQSANGFRSKWEAAYSQKLDMEVRAGLVRKFWYEPFSLWLPGKVRYKPDFLIQYPLGLERSLEIVEVKGWSKNVRDGMTRLKIAAALFPCFTWKLVRQAKGGGWEEETL